jgi:CDP-diacylglycerol--glycerol-3-phosphate 3-phosphatidyltransferase
LDSVLNNKSRSTLADQLRVRFKWVLDPIGTFFNRLGVKPNTMTILGLIGNAVGAVFLALGNMTIGGLIILAMGPVDALDGTMARLRGEASNFGSFVDSVTDRYSELVIFGGLLVHFLVLNDWRSALGVYLAAAGSVLVSFVRARGEASGYNTKIGILTRLERYLVLSPALILNIPMVGVWIIAVLANLTALQRILDVRRQAHHK